MKRDIRHLARIAAVALVCAPAIAGGPIAIYDPATKTPYAWPAGVTVPVYTDLGALGQLTNEQADAMVAFGADQWSAVPTSALDGVIAGDFGAAGLPDITAGNLGDVLFAWNGGGIHVVYDADGSITEALFGWAGGVNGITFLEYVDENSPAIREVTIILNGYQVPGDWVTPVEAAAQFAGVSTHELGHAFGLAHSQTNGQIFFYYDPWAGPAGCPTPYEGLPPASSVETMYPFTQLSQTGEPQSTVDILDDIANISDLYPEAGWPDDAPSITGTVYLPERQAHPYTGANVIARNVDNPWIDAVSAISGDRTQGLAGPDGAYAFHGLTPGASYVIYIDGIIAGAFSTPLRTLLPGPEEYYNGSHESWDGRDDDRCAYAAVVPTAAHPAVADLYFNKVKGAPEFIPIDLPQSPITELSGDGDAAVGVWEGGVYRWVPGEVQLLGGDWRSPQAGISRDGRAIAASVADENGNQTAALWRAGQGWANLGALPGSDSCDALLSSGWGVSDDLTVVGLDWLGCNNVTAFKWTSADGMTSLGYLGPDDDLGGSRANRISADNSTIVGWDRDRTGFWRGAMWRNGQESIFHQPEALCCDWDPEFCTVRDVGVANAVSPRGSIVVGENYAVPQVYVDPGTGDAYHYCTDGSWKWTQGGGVQYLGDFLPDYSPKATDVSDDGEVIVGTAFPFDFFNPRRSVIWTEPTGFLDFQEFLASQGTFANDWLLQVAGTVSGDGKTVGGFAFSPYGGQGFVVKMPKIVVCHAPPGQPSRKASLDVAFPESLPMHLAHGDTIGLCGSGM